MLNKLWNSLHDQETNYGKDSWSVSRLVDASKELKPFDCDLKAMNFSGQSPCDNTVIDFAAHCKKVMDCDFKHPIIMHPDGTVLDGRHRIVKALIEGKKTIKAVRFDWTNFPSPCKTSPE